jgi:hypothetical protein
MEGTALEMRFRQVLDKLGVPLLVCWKPNDKSLKHGEIVGGTILIFDVDEDAAWDTLLHEIFEFKLKDVTLAYRTVINELLGIIEKLTYDRKERFLNSIPEITGIIRRTRKE